MSALIRTFALMTALGVICGVIAGRLHYPLFWFWITMTLICTRIAAWHHYPELRDSMLLARMDPALSGNRPTGESAGHQ